MSDLYEPHPELLLTRFRGRIAFASAEQDSAWLKPASNIGFATTYRVGRITLWNASKNAGEVLSVVCLQ